MASRTRISSLDDLLRLTDSSSIEELSGDILGRTLLSSGVGNVAVKATTSGVNVKLSGSFPVPAAFYLAFPFAISKFWQMVKDLDHEMADAEIWALMPEQSDEVTDIWTLGPGYGPEQAAAEAASAKLMERLSTNWRLNYFELLEAIGGGWHPIDARQALHNHDQGVQIEESRTVWIASGDPLMVALGVCGTYVWVAVPNQIYPGFHGPGFVKVDIRADILRIDSDFLDQLSQAIAEAIDSARQQLAICWGCRQLRPIYERQSRRVGFCRQCMTVKFHMSID